MSDTANADHLPGHGIEALIERLREDGIGAGRQAAAVMLEDARREAGETLALARREAERTLREARAALREERAAAESAIRAAYRDCLLRLREELVQQLAGRLRRRLGQELSNPALLNQLVGAVVAAPDVAPAPTSVDALAQQLIAEMLVDGVEVLTIDGQAGLRLRWSAEHLEVQLGEEAIGQLLMRYLTPSVRALLDEAPSVGQSERPAR
jgi:V/A-type H+-transporting ATPase subunit E